MLAVSRTADLDRPQRAARALLGPVDLCQVKISIRRGFLSSQRRATQYHSPRALRRTIGCAVRRGRVPCNAGRGPLAPGGQSVLVSARLVAAGRVVSCIALLRWPWRLSSTAQDKRRQTHAAAARNAARGEKETTVRGADSVSTPIDLPSRGRGTLISPHLGAGWAPCFSLPGPPSEPWAEHCGPLSAGLCRLTRSLGWNRSISSWRRCCETGLAEATGSGACGELWTDLQCQPR